MAGYLSPAEFVLPLSFAAKLLRLPRRSSADVRVASPFRLATGAGAGPPPATRRKATIWP